MNNLLKTFIIATALSVTACSEQDPLLYIKEGKALFEKGQLKEAKVQFKNALQINPKLAEAYYGMALLDEKHNEFGSMKKNLEDTVLHDPNHLQAHIKLGFLMLDQLEKAKELVAQAVKLNPQDTNVMVLQASVKYKEADKEGAKKLLDQAFVQDKTNLKATYLQYIMLTDKKLYERALSIVEQALKAHPEEMKLYIAQIDMLKKLNQSEQVIKAYEIMTAKFPGDVMLRRTQLDYLLKNGNSEQLKLALDQTIEQMPDELEFKLAKVNLLMREDKTQVENLLQDYIKQNPEETQLKFRLAGLYIGAKKFTEAKTLLDKITAGDATGQDGMKAKVRLAEIALTEQQPEKAENLITEILTTDASNTEALLIRAGMRLGKNQLDDAIADLRIVLRDHADSDKALDMMARASLLKGEVEVAESYWKKAIDANPKNLNAVMALNSVLVRRGKVDRVEELLIDSLKANPMSPQLTELLVKIQIASKKWSAAEANIAPLLKDPQFQLAGKMLQGMLAEAQEKPAQALEAYQTVLKEQPASVAALNAIANVYKRSQHRDQLIQFMAGFIQQYPENFVAHNLLAQGYALTNNWAKAESVLQASLRLQPAASASYKLLAEVYLQQNKNKEAIALYQLALQGTPESVVLRMELAKIYERSQDYTSAIAAYQDVVKSVPENLEAVNNLAYLLVEYANDSSALQQAVAISEPLKNTANPFFQDTYGWVLFRSGDIENAVNVLKKAVSVVPKNVAFRYHLAEAYYARGDYQASKVELEKSLTLDESQGNAVESEKARQLLQKIADSQAA